MKVLICLWIVVFALVLKVGASESPAQEDSKKISVFTNIDFVTSHVWRGGKSGNAPSIEPLIELSSGNVSFGTWAAATFDGEYKELDLYINYNIKDFSIGVFDYYCPPKELSEAKFTNFSKASTYHLYSIDVTYNGSKKVPVKLTASTMMYGMDYNSQTGDYYFSTYLEAQYNKNWEANSVSVVLGMTTHEGIYAPKTAIVNTEFQYKRKFDLKYFSLPVFAKVVYNPYSNKAFVIGGLSISKGFKI